MTVRYDQRGVPVSAGRSQSLEHYETALRQFQSYVGDPLATLDSALAEDPQFVSGHLARALILFTVGERKFVADVEASLAKAQAADASDRERMLMAAVRQLIDGQWHAACQTLDRVLIEHPCDVLALQAAHLMDFFRGDALNLRNRVTRVLPHWDATLPGYSYVLGMHAFGLEEMNQYPEAEAQARRALELERKDGWAVHAGTHVMEMQGRIDEGIAWLEARKDDWVPDNAFAFHNWWHLALFHLDGAHYGRALELFDQAIHPEKSPILLSLVDATALLWRLQLEDADVGQRFEGIADEWEAQLDAEAGFYAFNDFHAALAFVAAGRTQALETLQAAMRHAAEGSNATAAMQREVGLQLVDGVIAFGQRRYRDAIEHIAPVRDIANRFGGSHAQRDLITLTLIEAATRAKDPVCAKHFIAERQLLKTGGSRWGDRLMRRVPV
jgi:tetratricopeptide (TPR) repeat protein